MKTTMRHWIGGRDHHDDKNAISSYCGVLSFEGRPVGFCYYSYITRRHHQIMVENCPSAVMKFLKNRITFTTKDIFAVINMMLDVIQFKGKDIAHPVAARIPDYYKANNVARECGAPLPFYNGKDYIADVAYGGELTLLLNREATKKHPFPYWVRIRSATDRQTVYEQNWTAIQADLDWYGTRDLINFTMFKIGCINSLPVDLSAIVQHT